MADTAQRVGEARRLERVGRRLRLGIVGGGLDSTIGPVHYVAARVDGCFDLVAGALSNDPEIAVSSGRALLMDPERIYTDYREMARRERERDDPIDAVVIATPPQTHAAIAKEFLNNDVHVLCEKPLCATVEEAEELRSVVSANDALFTVTFCYTGYPMVREAREIVRSGRLGRILVAEGEAGLGVPVAGESEEPGREHWRWRAESMGAAALLGEVGSHAHHILEYVLGQRVTAVSASMQTLIPTRSVFDNAYVNAKFDGGAFGRLWTSYVAAGVEHGLSFRVFGERGGLRWVQQVPDELWLTCTGRPAELRKRGNEYLSQSAQRSARVPPGHPEGYFLAFAQIYRDFSDAILGRMLGESVDESLDVLPSLDDGIASVRLIRAATESNDEGGAWISV